ncbi:MAG: hypothetical protein ACD_62C00609G0006 [uncultured bacterium]|nr:MAG: hypothetical protein ACD_62C00609G0006 [uncultured bacterium]HLD45826.1 hypothetical protein [bacterium]
MKWHDCDNKLQKSGFKVFSNREFQGISGASAVASKFMLMRYTNKGLLCRLKRDLYQCTNRMASPWLIANQLYKPSYLSLESALSYYGLIPESVYSVTSVTTKTTRGFEAGNHLYSYRTIKASAFGGYRSVMIADEQIMMAEREKALADYLYFVFLKKIVLNERLSFTDVKKRRLHDYLLLFERPDLEEWYRHDFKISDHRIAR